MLSKNSSYLPYPPTGEDHVFPEPFLPGHTLSFMTNLPQVERGRSVLGTIEARDHRGGTTYSHEHRVGSGCGTWGAVSVGRGIIQSPCPGFKQKSFTFIYFMKKVLKISTSYPCASKYILYINKQMATEFQCLKNLSCLKTDPYCAQQVDSLHHTKLLFCSPPQVATDGESSLTQQSAFVTLGKICSISAL